MMLRLFWWCCPQCEVLCPIWQTHCGACASAKVGDEARLSVGEALDFQRDAAIFGRKPPSPPKR